MEGMRSGGTGGPARLLYGSDKDEKAAAVFPAAAALMSSPAAARRVEVPFLKGGGIVLMLGTDFSPIRFFFVSLHHPFV